MAKNILEEQSNALLTDSALLNLRLTYRNATIPVLEAFRFRDLQTSYDKLRSITGVQEAVILQTCNRLELFLACTHTEVLSCQQAVLGYWSREAPSSLDLAGKIEVSTGMEVLQHLLQLAVGLDSMVVGEDQILGQVRRSLGKARKYDGVGQLLTFLFNYACRVGAKVRTETAVNKGAVSLGSVAVGLAIERLDNMRNKKVLLIGAGVAGISVVKALSTLKLEVFVASRTLERATALTQITGGTPVTFEHAMKLLASVDLLIVATSAPYTLLSKGLIEEARRTKNDRELLIIDLSNPRNVEPSVALLPGIHLKTIDDLKGPSKRNLRLRSSRAKKSKELIEKEMIRLNSFLRRKKLEPQIAHIYREADRTRRREYEKAIELSKDFTPHQLQVVEELTKAVAEGILSKPVLRLRKAAEKGQTAEVKTAMELLIGDSSLQSPGTRGFHLSDDLPKTPRKMQKAEARTI